MICTGVGLRHRLAQGAGVAVGVTVQAREGLLHGRLGLRERAEGEFV